VGGGIMGITLGYLLTRQGLQVDIYEASPELGGLAGPRELPDGTLVDRFYHAILSSDQFLHDLCAELDLLDQMRFHETKMGFYHNAAVYPMNSVVDFVRFPPLTWIDRFRLGMTILAAQRVRDWQQLESVSIRDWLVRWGGENAYENLWRPMLRAKFDGGFDQVPATWIWSRLVRMKSTRQGATQKEQAGHLVGGYITLLDEMAQAIRVAGGMIRVNTPVQEIAVEDDQVTGLRVAGELLPYATVVCTLQAPLFSRLIPGADAAYRAKLTNQEYLGVLCPLMVLDRPLTGYWTLNITDDSIPFTGIIETTSYIDPAYVGGHHLVYLPKYTLPGSVWQTKTDAEVEAIWLDNLARMFPDFDRRAVRYFLVHRERYVEPLHRIGEYDAIPTVTTPVHNLYLATTAQIYPALTNGESVGRHAQQVALQIADASERSLLQEPDPSSEQGSAILVSL
jgi:protoporphyrinogen oxidase